MVELRIKIAAKSGGSIWYIQVYLCFLYTAAVYTITWQIVCSIWKRFFYYNPDMCCLMHKYSHKLQRKQLCVMLFFLFLSSLLFLMRHEGRHCKSSGHPALFDNPSVRVFLASTPTHPPQSGAASPPTLCQMLWPGLQTICTPAGGGVKSP